MTGNFEPAAQFFWANYRSFEYSELAKKIRIFHWSGPNGARKEIQERGLDSHKLMDCLVALFCFLFSPQTSIPEPVAANQYYSESIMKSQKVFCFFCSHLDKTSLFMTA